MKGILAVGADQHPGTDQSSAASAVTPAHLHGPDSLFAHLDAEDRDAQDRGEGVADVEAVGA